MLSGLDLSVVGVIGGDGCLCRKCAVKRYGEPHAQRIMVGLGSDYGPAAMSQYEANSRAIDWGYECNCDAKPMGEFCAVCAETNCDECGARLDEVPCAA